MNDTDFKVEAIARLAPNVGFAYNEKDGISQWESDTAKPTKDQIEKEALEVKKGPFNVSAVAFDHSGADGSGEGNDSATITATGHTFIVGDRVVFEGLGGFSGTSQNGNLNEDPGSEVASVSGNNFVIEKTDNKKTHTYTSGGTVSSIDDSWQRHGSTWTTSDDHLF